MRFKHTDEEENTDRWMVSYADFVTLLFAFFVVMYAISSVNDEKYRVLSATLAETFSVDQASTEPIQVGDPSLSASPHIVDFEDTTAYADQNFGDTFIKDPVEAAESLQGGFTDTEGVSVKSNNDWLEISLNANVLFKPGQVRLSSTAELLLDGALSVLRNTVNPVTIEGYTDNVPSESILYPSNWELSAARASIVARHFVSRGVRAERISAVGYGENHPLATNATPQGRDANRRVVIVVARRTDTSRNLNAGIDTAAFATVRSTPVKASIDNVVQQRKADGGLLFSNEASVVNDDNAIDLTN